MAVRHDNYWKIQPSRQPSDLGRALAAEVHDPAWFIARQWLVGELQGTDGGTPTRVTFEPVRYDIAAPRGERSPAEVPVESTVEHEVESFWTPGRRVRYGAAYARAVPTATRDLRLRCDDLPPPYQRLNARALDGRKAHAANPFHEVFSDVPRSGGDHFRPAHFDHRIAFPVEAGGLGFPPLPSDPQAASVTVASRGDTVQWYDAVLRGRLPRTEPQRRSRTRVEPLQFPGAPNPRWWQIEDTRADPARMGADRSHPVTLLLIELVSRLSREWHGFVWPTVAGSLSGVRRVIVEDTFDQLHQVRPPARDEWSLFQLSGTHEPLLLHWVNAVRPLASDRSSEDIQLSVDEATGVVWARELRVGGADLQTPQHDERAGQAEIVDWNAVPERVYHPLRGVDEAAHPYLPTEGASAELDQGRLADLSVPEPRWQPLARGSMIGAGERHQIAAGVVTQRGLQLDRRWVLSRDVDGRPLLWHRRRKLPLPTALPNLVRFDQVEITQNEIDHKT